MSPHDTPARFVVVADHNGNSLKAELVTWLVERNHPIDDRSASLDGVVDYPPLCAAVCTEIVEGNADFGLVIGGSGQGEQIACNKFRGVRAALCHCLFTTEIARAHNDANVLVMGAKLVTSTIATEIVQRWLTTPFKEGVHRRRLDQIAAIERGEMLT